MLFLQPFSPLNSTCYGMKRLLFMLLASSFCATELHAQGFRVQMAAYTERQDASFFKEKGVDAYIELADESGIFWYIAGNYPTLQEADLVRSELVMKGFSNALIIDEEAQYVLSGANCPYIRDGVVYVEDPNSDPNKHIIYFDFGRAYLDPTSKSVLDEVYLKMKELTVLTLKIHGYTDGVGDARANLELAAERSRAARDYLIYKGIRADRMFMEVFGEAEPAAPNAEDDGSNSGKGRDLPENRKWNRRVTLTLEQPDQTGKYKQKPK
jgi:outer membrane protein OmpA-like peptidoglycan-associated protein